MTAPTYGEVDRRVAASASSLEAQSNLPWRHQVGRAVAGLFLVATLLTVASLIVLLTTVFARGWDWLSWGLLTEAASRFPEESGLRPALAGTLWVISIMAAFALPVGIGAAIYLEEYAPRTRWTRLLEVNIANLAGVPSVVYGLLGLGIFVDVLGFGRSVLTGSLTLGLLILPVIIIASREALRAVPLSLRQGAFALGATPWQVVRHHVLPAALPGVMTGTILAFSRAIGETAPLLVAGAAGTLFFSPSGPLSAYTVLPVQIYQWTGRPQTDFRDVAAAGIIVLLVVLLSMNAVAIFLRQRFGQTRW